MDRIAPESMALADMKAAEQRLRALLLQGMEGDAQAYQAFLKGLSTHLRAFLRRRLSTLPDDIEDLVQDILLAVHNQRHTYRPDQPLTAWVNAMARYKLIDLLRSRSGREALHDPIDDDMALFATNDHDAANARRDVNTLLNQLPDNQRLPIVHTKLEGLSVTEAAAATGMSESAIKVGVHRGMKALAALMSKSLRSTP
ncbi:MAG: sigma-70 family RNA polymerase sigma factor [Burkholderiaceae bacterium]|nr:sigma-70 family RNA polymerase sigma factor [Burkholderiaceae bacterium]